MKYGVDGMVTFREGEMQQQLLSITALLLRFMNNNEKYKKVDFQS